MNTSEKSDIYDKVLNQLESLFSEYEKDAKLSIIAKMASICSALRREFINFNFVGFYLITNNEHCQSLEIGPCSSEIVAIPRIDYGKGVCGRSWKKRESIIVNNVNKCDYYIACSPEVTSEIVLPVYEPNGKIMHAVLDIDSKVEDLFDDQDEKCLELIISKFIK